MLRLLPMSTVETKMPEQTLSTPEELEGSQEHSEIFTSASEAISMYSRLGAELAETYNQAKEGDLATVNEFEEAYDKALTVAYEPSASHLDSDERRKAFDQFDYILDSRDDTGEIGTSPQRSFNILLEMAWDIREDSGSGDDTLELIGEFAERWNLSKDEIITVGELTKLDTDEFDMIQTQLINSSLSFMMVEESNRIIDSNELPSTTENEKKAREVEKEKLAQEEAWLEVNDKITSLYPELEGVDIVESDLNRALALANHDRREMLAILRRVGGSDLEDVNALVEPYTADNLEDSQWILGFLLKSDIRYDILNTKSNKSKKFESEHNAQIDVELGKKLAEDRTKLLRGLTKLYGATLTDPKSGLPNEVFSVLHELSRQTSGEMDESETTTIGTATRKAFRNHYEVQLDGETHNTGSRFNSEKAKDDFYEIWGEVLSKGNAKLRKIGHAAVAGIASLKKSAEEFYTDDVESKIEKEKTE